MKPGKKNIHGIYFFFLLDFLFKKPFFEGDKQIILEISTYLNYMLWL